MGADQPADKLRKVKAVIADPGATQGEKAAAEAAAGRIRARHRKERADEARAAIEENGTMYLLGRALGRAQRRTGGDGPGGKGVMYALGRAWKKATTRT
jgi:hypothetical protein